MKSKFHLNKILWMLIFFGIFVKADGYAEDRARYDNFAENDERALEFVGYYILNASKHCDFRELSQAYRDAVSFSVNDKLLYADSAITAALRSGNREAVGNAYMTKGSVYYFTFRKYGKALDQYLKAWEYLKNSEQAYLHYKNLYHIAVVKNYLGYHEEAYSIFSKCRVYYKDSFEKSVHPNLKYNSKKGYLNSLNQMALCLLYTSKTREAEKIIREGLAQSAGDLNFDIERSYFYKLRGWLGYLNKNDHGALSDFKVALVGIERKDDFANASLTYYFKGRLLLRNGKRDEGIRSLKKIDSVFVKHHFVLPVVREAYELLIGESREEGSDKEELYYTRQLLEVDKVLAEDFKYLSGKIYREYDTLELRQSEKELVASVRLGYIILTVAVGLLVICFVWGYRRWKKEAKNEDLDDIFEEGAVMSDDRKTSVKNTKLSEKLVEAILGKLDIMEQEAWYLEKGISMNKVAKRMKTNTAYLSAVINEHKGVNFNAYINQLRVSYAREMLISDAQWRKYSVETLAKECGFSNRSVFSKYFTELTAMSPAQFADELNKTKEK